jgi:hypothetical protein
VNPPLTREILLSMGPGERRSAYEWRLRGKHYEIAVECRSTWGTGRHWAVVFEENGNTIRRDIGDIEKALADLAEYRIPAETEGAA